MTCQWLAFELKACQLKIKTKKINIIKNMFHCLPMAWISIGALLTGNQN